MLEWLELCTGTQQLVVPRFVRLLVDMPVVNVDKVGHRSISSMYVVSVFWLGLELEICFVRADVASVLRQPIVCANGCPCFLHQPA